MLRSDIAVKRCRLQFRDVRLEPPFVLASGTISEFTVAYVDVDVEDRSGIQATGRGATVLSVLWAWPDPELSVADRDGQLRALMEELNGVVEGGEPADPFEHWGRLTDWAQAASAWDHVPQLAVDLALGAFDNAIHDAWARAADRVAYDIYHGEYLARDLGAWLGPDLAGRWPGDFLVGTPLDRLAVQHVVSVSDPLAESIGSDRSLRSWLDDEQPRHIKVKLAGRVPTADADRVADVYRTALGAGNTVRLSLDPNEGYASPQQVVELMEALARIDPQAHAAVDFVEQPTPRAVAGNPDDMVAAGVPVVMDEGLACLADLDRVVSEGWGGLVVKAAKGQSFALLCHAFAKAHGLFITLQDLTAVDLALEHSASLAARLDRSCAGFEYNSRQYAAAANRELLARQPELVTVVGGEVSVRPFAGSGLYP